MKNYNDIRRESNYQILEFSDAINLYNQIMDALPDDDRSNKMKNEFLKSICDYAELRCKWYLMEISSRVEKDKTRTVYHEGLIFNMNSMEKYLANLGVDTGFLKVVKDENRTIERKKIGDFACVVYAILGIISR